MALHPDGRLLASGGADKTLRVWSTEEASELAKYPVAHPVRTLAFTPDSSRLASAPFGGMPRVDFWQTGTWRPLPSFDPGIGPVQALAFSPDGTLAAAGGFGKVALWDVD